MKFFKYFTAAAFTASANVTENTECGPGMAKGINSNGEIDETNTDTCYTTSDSAFIFSCNNQETQAAEMRIAIEKV